jgi:hypothetical protein
MIIHHQRFHRQIHKRDSLLAILEHVEDFVSNMDSTATKSNLEFRCFSKSIKA